MSSESKDGILAVSGSLLGLSTLVVGLRLCARKQQNAKLMTDDALAVLSLVSKHLTRESPYNSQQGLLIEVGIQRLLLLGRRHVLSSVSCFCHNISFYHFHNLLVTMC